MSSPSERLAFSRDETSVDPSARSSITPTQSLDSIVRGRALRMLRAHGLDAGPTQRPLLAGAIAGLIADIPATALLELFGSLGALGPTTGASPVVAGLA